MSNYFFSDTHWHHKNIVKGVSEWDRNEGDQKTRDFKTLEEHDEAIIQGINKVVQQDDIFWHLGDWSFGGIEQIWNFRKRLICQNINLIFGNHDQHIEKNKKLPNCRHNANNYHLIEDGIEDIYHYGVESQELFNSTQYVYFGKIGQQTYFLSHYAHRVWNKSHHGVIHLYGHSHDTLDNKGQEWGRSMDVSVESSLRIYGEIRPFHEMDIIKIMNKRQPLIIDHHNSKTN